MFGIGSAELALILLVAFFVVGPQRLPEIARMIAKTIGFFRKNIEEINEAIKEEPEEEPGGVDEPFPSDETTEGFKDE